MITKFKGKISRKVRKLLSPTENKSSPPLFRGKLHGFPAELNAGNTYPTIVTANPLFNAPLVELVHYLGQDLKRQVNLIDVGSACGDTVMLLEQRCAGVVREYLCIDGDVEFGGHLRKNMSQFKNVRIVETMLAGDSMQVPELVKHHKGSAGCFGEKKVSARRLDDVLADELFQPDLLKIDVDGFDGEVLRGAKSMLRKNNPAVIFEWHPKLYANAGQDFKTPFQVLDECGYRHFLWFDNTGEFSHFSIGYDDKTISAMRDFLIAVNQRRDQHFDIIAFHGVDCKRCLSIAILEYAREAAAKYPAI